MPTSLENVPTVLCEGFVQFWVILFSINTLSLNLFLSLYQFYELRTYITHYFLWLQFSPIIFYFFVINSAYNTNYYIRFYSFIRKSKFSSVITLYHYAPQYHLIIILNYTLWSLSTPLLYYPIYTCHISISQWIILVTSSCLCVLLGSRSRAYIHNMSNSFTFINKHPALVIFSWFVAPTFCVISTVQIAFLDLDSSHSSARTIDFLSGCINV